MTVVQVILSSVASDVATLVDGELLESVDGSTDDVNEAPPEDATEVVVNAGVEATVELRVGRVNETKSVAVDIGMVSGGNVGMTGVVCPPMTSPQAAASPALSSHPR